MKKMLRIYHFAPVALVMAGLLLAGGARAQNPLRGCYQGNPDMICPLAECILLDAAVHAPDSCSSQSDPLSGCNKISGCFNLRQARSRWLRCYQTRTILNMRCWRNGGDFEHQEQAAIAIGKVAECDARIKLPSPVGCGDPCPWK